MTAKTHVCSTFLFFSILAFVGCSDSVEGWGTWDGEVISRVASPDGAVEAIIVEGSAGATDGFSSRVYLVLPGTEYSNKLPMFDPKRTIVRADGVNGLTIVWKDSKTLEIRYQSARIFQFTNFVDRTDSQQKMTRYNIRLIEVSDQSAYSKTQNTEGNHS